MSWVAGEWGEVNPIAPRKAKIVYNFGLSECNRVNVNFGINFLICS